MGDINQSMVDAFHQGLDPQMIIDQVYASHKAFLAEVERNKIKPNRDLVIDFAETLLNGDSLRPEQVAWVFRIYLTMKNPAHAEFYAKAIDDDIVELFEGVMEASREVAAMLKTPTGAAALRNATKPVAMETSPSDAMSFENFMAMMGTPVRSLMGNMLSRSAVPAQKAEPVPVTPVTKSKSADETIDEFVKKAFPRG